MNKLWIVKLVFLTVLLISCQSGQNGKADMASGPNTLTDAEKAAGWQLLFDGKTFDGWRGLNQEGVPEGHWVIENNCIKKNESGDVPVLPDGQPVKGGDLVTLDTFQNFEFAFEWKVDPASNSGVKYNVEEKMSRGGSALGFEYQVIDDIGHPDGLLVTHQAGDLYDMISSNDQKVLKPVGEFNSSKIVFNGMHGEHWLNGKKIVEFDMDTPEFAALLAASKYKDIERFGERKKGHIILQDHSDYAWYRNLKIKRLPE